MNKFVWLGLAVVSTIFAGCHGFYFPGPFSDQFRVNMSFGFSAHFPKLPAPKHQQWNDVGYWQTFLVGQGCLTTKYKFNEFDGPTEKATRKFQSKHYTALGADDSDVLPETGCVDLATFHKAILLHMHQYKAVRVDDGCISRAHGTIFLADSFHNSSMGANCMGNDVKDWQTFLKNNGYLPLNFTVTGTYDANTTKPATKRFQVAWSIPQDTQGDVGPKTFAYALDPNSSFANQGGTLLVSQDQHTAPTPTGTGCGTP